MNFEDNDSSPCYEEGRVAYRDGYGFDECPYMEWEEERESWEAGWLYEEDTALY